MYYLIKKFLLISIILLIIIIALFHKNYCLKCHKEFKLNLKCQKCRNELIFKGIEILSDDDTLNEIIINKKSISRFGDGEYGIIFGKNIDFQSHNKNLSKKLIQVLNSNNKNCLVGINIPYKKKDLKKLTNEARKYWINYLKKNKIKLARLIKHKKYYSATISRFYIRYRNKGNISKYIEKLKKIWYKKNILIIEGEKSRLGIGNNLFDNVKSIKRIICPLKNAFNVYDKIIKAVVQLPKKILILIALGPTATALAYDLNKLGYQSIDIGHVDIEYEWFLRNCTKKIQIKNKYVSEADGSRYKFNNLKDKNYFNQIIKKILH